MKRLAAKSKFVAAPAVEAFIKLVVGIILAAVFLAVGWLAFEAIAKDLVGALSGTGLGVLAGGVVVGVSIIVGATVLSLKK